jgi:hypothetical protein
MKFWIKNGELAGYSQLDMPEDQWPDGWVLVAGPNLPVEQVYWNGSEIVERPAAPSSRHLWAGTEWVEPPAPAARPNWLVMQQLLTDVDLLESISANSLFPALIARLQHLSSGQSFLGADDAIFALWNHDKPTLTPEQVTALNALATEHNLPLALASDGTLSHNP